VDQTGGMKLEKLCLQPERVDTNQLQARLPWSETVRYSSGNNLWDIVTNKSVNGDLFLWSNDVAYSTTSSQVFLMAFNSYYIRLHWLH
jgi:hypothetical protein